MAEPVACGAMHSLPLFVRLSGQTVILLGTGDAATAKRRLLERAGAIISDDEGADARIAFVALEGEAARAAASRLKARGMLVNVVDHIALCDFTMPAIVDRSPVLVAIGTGGASSGLAKTLRQRLEAILPANLGDLAAALGRVRGAMRVRWSAFDDFRGAVDRALRTGGPLDPMCDYQAGAVEDWLARDDEGAALPGRLETIRVNGDDPDMLTLRDVRLMGLADALWHDGGVPEAILSRARADAARHVSPAPPSVPTTGLFVWLEMVA